jgi:hypothetical protein
MKKVVNLICLSIVILSCEKATEPSSIISPQSNVFTDAEYFVLSSLLDSLQISSSVDTIVLNDSTDTGIFPINSDSTLTDLLVYIQEHIPTLASETIIDYKSKNLKRSFIDSPQKINVKCVLKSETMKVYPFISVSRVGFSSNGQQALAYIGSSYAPLAGAGIYYVLLRVQEKWNIVGSVMTWIS